MISKDKIADCSPLGVYIHVPFCAGVKCPYCDFYSVPYSEEVAARYIGAMEREIAARAATVRSRAVDTVYFGGGTPSLLDDGLARLLGCIGENFDVTANAEITFEANPAAVSYNLLALLRKAGFNRLSLGMQSGADGELAALGRRHTGADVRVAVEDARRAGFDNFSLDLMLCLPGQTAESMRSSVAFAAGLSARHISAYLLKIEPGTRFAQGRDARGSALNLPDDDGQAELYLAACEALEREGYRQYEISNFALSSFEARHNLKYWDCGEYLGIGPAAHSFLNGRRFYYPRDLNHFITGVEPVDDGAGGTLEEYLMLRLRLTEGVEEDALRRRYGRDFSVFDAPVAARLEKEGLIRRENGRLSLTCAGFLVSNSVIGALILNGH